MALFQKCADQVAKFVTYRGSNLDVLSYCKVKYDYING